MTSERTIKAFAALAVLAFAATVLVPHFLDGARATHQPADKMAVAGANVEIFGPGAPEPLLTGTMKTSSPTDVVLTVSLECSILTEVTTVGNDESSAFGRVVVWVEIDGQPVPVTAGDDGRVVFCDRAHEQETTLFDDEDATIRSYLKTRSSHSFTWVALNLGSAPSPHVIQVKAELTQGTSGTAAAEAAIGKRTLVAEPTKLANDVAI